MPGGHFVDGIEQAAVRVNGGFRKVDAVGFLREFGCGLVEADVAVVSQAQKLQVNAAGKQDGSLVGIACGLSIGVGAIGTCVFSGRTLILLNRCFCMK